MTHYGHMGAPNYTAHLSHPHLLKCSLTNLLWSCLSCHLISVKLWDRNWHARLASNALQTVRWTATLANPMALPLFKTPLTYLSRKYAGHWIVMCAHMLCCSFQGLCVMRPCTICFISIVPSIWGVHFRSQTKIRLYTCNTITNYTKAMWHAVYFTWYISRWGSLLVFPRFFCGNFFAFLKLKKKKKTVWPNVY